MADPTRRKLGPWAAAVIFLLIPTLNGIGWEKTAENYYPLRPHYGAAFSHHRAASLEDGDRSWLLYSTIEKAFAGWTLISFDKAPAMASSMYALPYGGIEKTLILDYNPFLSDQEAAQLLSRPNKQAVLKRLGGRLVTILPPVGHPPGEALILRHGDDYFLVPESFTPKRFKGLR